MTILQETQRPIRVLISGNCLGAPLETAAAEAARILRIPLDVRYMRNYVDARGLEPGADVELKEFARQADFFIQQIGATMADPLAEIVPASAKVFRYPAVRLNFLWPFATRPP